LFFCRHEGPMIPAGLIHKRFTRFFLPFMAAAMFFLIGLASSVTASEETPAACFRTLAEEALACSPQICPGNLYAGGSVSFRLAPGSKDTKLVGPSQAWLSLTVMDREFPVVVLPDSFYTGYHHLTLGPTDYWIVSEFTGVTQCCDRFHVFSRPAPGKSVIYLGVTTSGEASRSEPFLSCRDASLYLEDRDVRFLHFHIPDTESQLLFPRHYQVTPFTLSVENKPFLDKYLKLVRETEGDIRKILAERKEIPDAIFILNGPDVFFSDLLGQLLVRRTLLYLYAGETETAWRKLAEDIRRYYQTDRFLAQLQAEITQILALSPY